MTEKRYQVFVSSTYLDLVEERQKVMQSLLELDCFPVGMELFPASDDDQWTLIKGLVKTCDYYILIIGGRYGSENELGKSYTQMEYEYALENNIPILTFIHGNPAQLPNNKVESSIEKINKLDNFKELAQRKHCNYWKTPDELSREVTTSLVKLIKYSPGVGWIRADSRTSEHNILLKEYKDLSEKNLALELRNKDYVHVYKSFDEVWPDLRGILDLEIEEAKAKSEKVKIRCLGLCLHKSIPSITEYLIQNMNILKGVQIDMRLSTFDSESTQWKLLNKIWDKHQEVHDSLMDEFVERISKHDDARLTIKRYKYNHMPNWHGILVNHTHLFLSACMWDSYNTLTAGQNTYEYYCYGKSERHNDKIKLYNRWFDYGRYNGTVSKEDALFFESDSIEK